MKKNITFKLSLLLILLVPTLLLAKNSSEEYLKKAETSLPSQCLFYFKMYLHAKGPKAFAYAIDSKEKVTCRYSSSSKNQKKADEVALASCEKSSLAKGILSPCKIYQINSNISRTRKQLDFEDKYLVNLNQVKKELSHTDKKIKNKKTIVEKDITLLPKQCLMFYHLYEKAKEHKAFAIVIESDEKYTCRYSAGSNSRQKADEVALASCERTRVSRGIKKACQLFVIKEDTQKKPIQKIKKETKVTPSPSLEKAILSADLKKIKSLIKKGADINVEASDKSRALFVAVAQGDIAFTKELLEKGAFVFIKKRDGNNLLVAAIMSGNNKMLRLMLEQNIDPNIRCEDGNTPLHFALMMFDDKMMKTLYAFSARDDIKNNKEKSVKDLAKEFRLNLKRIKR